MMIRSKCFSDLYVCPEDSTLQPLLHKVCFSLLPASPEQDQHPSRGGHAQPRHNKGYPYRNPGREDYTTAVRRAKDRNRHPVPEDSPVRKLLRSGGRNNPCCAGVGSRMVAA